MKVRFFAIVLWLYSIASIPTETYKINDAISKFVIKADINGNPSSTHYYEPVILSIQNNEAKHLTLDIPEGMLLCPENINEQTLIITEQNSISLAPKQLKIIKLKAMCIEPSDASGSEKSSYTIAVNKNDTLVNFAKFINKNNYFTSCAQHAFWTLVRKESVAGVYGSDTIEQKKIRDYLHKYAGLPLPKPYEYNDYRYNYYTPPPPKETLKGYFQFGMRSPHNIQIAMFDTTGILVRELFNQKQYSLKNNEKIAYEFDFTIYTHDKYYIKLIVDNEIIMNRTVDAKSFRDNYKSQLQNRN